MGAFLEKPKTEKHNDEGTGPVSDVLAEHYTYVPLGLPLHCVINARMANRHVSA